MYRFLAPPPDLPPWVSRFGIRSVEQLRRDVGRMLGRASSELAVSLGSAGLLRPSLSLPAYAGLVPKDGAAPIFNFFDRNGGGLGFRGVATRKHMRDYRGGKLSYDEHDGTDFVCPPGTPLVAAAPGVLVAYRDNWLRGGLTACVDHGFGVVTQYTHLSKRVAEPGQSLRRGDVVALSGHAGIDMTLFFPWVPPHIHFMVWVGGKPVDPYRARGESARAGTWLHDGDPQTSGPLPTDTAPPSINAISVDRTAIERAIDRCLDNRTKAEITGAHSDLERAAILEDSIHHERSEWPEACRALRFRSTTEASRVKLTLPLPSSIYQRARAADAPWTRPRGD